MKPRKSLRQHLDSSPPVAALAGTFHEIDRSNNAECLAGRCRPFQQLVWRQPIVTRAGTAF